MRTYGNKKATKPRRRMVQRKKRRVSGKRMSLYRSPFPAVKNLTLVYKNPSQVLSTSSTFGYTSLGFIPTDIYDYDFSNVVGNKQPLYFDQIFTATGPYRSWKVNAWKTKIKVINLSDKVFNVYWEGGSLAGVTDLDTPIEMKNRPGVQYKMLTAQGNAKPYCEFTSYRTTKGCIPQYAGQEIVGSYDAGPSKRCVQTLLIEHLDGVIGVSQNYAVQIETVFYVTAYERDASQSI